jgi:large subunit ribosomal protein L54
MSAAPKSACTENTVLVGLNWLKGQPDVVALPDDQYPPWLWDLLKPKKFADDGPGSVADHARRNKENRQKIRDSNFMKTQ